MTSLARLVALHVVVRLDMAGSATLARRSGRLHITALFRVVDVTTSDTGAREPQFLQVLRLTLSHGLTDTVTISVLFATESRMVHVDLAACPFTLHQRTVSLNSIIRCQVGKMPVYQGLCSALGLWVTFCRSVANSPRHDRVRLCDTPHAYYPTQSHLLAPRACPDQGAQWSVVCPCSAPYVPPIPVPHASLPRAQRY